MNSINAIIKKVIIINFFIILYIGCVDKQSNEIHLTKAEQIVDSIFVNSFIESDLSIEFDTTTNPILLYHSIENYFIFIGILKGKNQNEYKKMCRLIIENKKDIELKCLNDFYPETQLLVFPSILSAKFYGFEVAFEKIKYGLSDKSSIKIAYGKLQNIKNGYDINYNIKAFQDYIDSIDKFDFENKFIYRVPILAFIHDYLLWKRD